VGTYRWLNDWFEPLTARIADIWHGEDPVQGYCDYLNHRMTMAQKLHADVDPMKAFEDWVANGFPGFDMSHI